MADFQSCFPYGSVVQPDPTATDEAWELSGRIVVKTDCGIGFNTGVEEEVVFIGAAFFDKGLVESDDPSKPWCYDGSRDTLLQLAQTLCEAGYLDEFGLVGPAVKYVIPGIPYPKGSDNKGDQKHDVGGHVTFSSRPGNAANGAPYTTPNLAKAKKMNGREVKLTFLPPSKGIKILVGSEHNDMETGMCYYINLLCDDNSMKLANDIKVEVGLKADITQHFHLALAGAAPAWQRVHPKSVLYSQATDEDKKCMDLENDFQVFRKGKGSFVGFNADAVTGWSTHAARSAAIGSEIAAISKSLEEFQLTTPVLSQAGANPQRDDKICKLESELDLKKKMNQELGYPKAITNRDATEMKSLMPDRLAQDQIMTTFADKHTAQDQIMTTFWRRIKSM